MSDTKSGRNVGRDALGILGLVVGVFSAVSVVMAATRDVGAEASGTTALFLWLTQFLGPIACVFAALGLALLGTRLWLRGDESGVGRHLLGILLTTFTLSVLVGALDAELGGRFGGGLGSAVARTFTVWVAVPTGLALVLLPAWFVWLRPAELSRARENPSSVPSKGLESPDVSSVSAAEAEALLPRTPVAKPAAVTVPEREPLPKPAPHASTPATSTTPAASPAQPAASTSPYPPDVRRSGGIPAGARPIESPHARFPQDQGDVDQVQHAGARAAAQPGAGVAAAPVAGVRPVGGEVRPVAAAGSVAPRADLAGAGARPLSTGPVRDDVFAVQSAPPAPAPAPAAIPLAQATQPPAPSWEQPDMFEEPVDAYGTPLSLVESLRKTEAAAPDEEGDDDEAEALHAEGLDLEGAELDGLDLEDDADVESVRPLPAASLAQATVPTPSVAAPSVPTGVHSLTEAFEEDELDEDELAEDELAEDDSESEASIAGSAFPATEVGAMTAAEDDGEEEPTFELPAPAPVSALAQVATSDLGTESEAEGDGDAQAERVPVAEQHAASDTLALDDDDEAADEGSADETHETDVDVAAQAALETDEVEGTLEPEAESELEDSDSDSEDEDEDEEPVQPSLFDDLDPEPLRPAPRPAQAARSEPRSLPGTASVNPTPAPTVQAKVSEPAPASTLSDVVLQPQPARSVSRVFVPESTYRAGCLFLERNRVAVSMLQREFQMDFKVATEVLDQLQDLGLIGPYLGGQRRDILMTPEEWSEKVGVAD